MKIHSLLLLACLPLGAIRAAEKPTPAPEPKQVLAIVVVETLQRQTAITDYDRFDIAFHDLARKRKWPVTLKVERFAANMPAYDPEVRLFTRPLREETPGDLTYRAWVTVTIRGEKHDFGIVTYRTYPRAGENREDTLEKVFAGAAQAIAGKFEPLLFPGTSK